MGRKPFRKSHSIVSPPFGECPTAFSIPGTGVVRRIYTVQKLGTSYAKGISALRGIDGAWFCQPEGAQAMSQQRLRG
jgi:hypothetical protein